MSDRLIIYKDPNQRKVGAIIDLTDKAEKSLTSQKGTMKGRTVKQIDETHNNTTKKTNRSFL